MKKTIETIQDSWKKYLKLGAFGLGIFLLGAVGGTTLEGFEVFNQIIINTISGLITSAPIIIIFITAYLGLKTEIKIGFQNLIKNIPSYLERYEKIKLYSHTIEGAKR